MSEAFACVPDAGFVALLQRLGCTLAISTIKADRLILLGVDANGTLTQLPRQLPAPMGLAWDGQRLAVATRNGVLVYGNAPALAASYPHQPATYAALLVPSALYLCGELDLHDLAWAGDTLWAVNTRFSCLGTLADGYSFVPRWQPPFISTLQDGDACHLNGMALLDGEPRYATALATTSTPEGWRPTHGSAGIVLDVAHDAIIARGLLLPHSPRIIAGRLWLLLAGSGQLVQLDPDSGQITVVAQLPGFARGIAHHAGYLFVGVSHLRPTNHNNPPIAQMPPFCGVVAIDMHSGQEVGRLRYDSTVREIFEVVVLPLAGRVGVLPWAVPEGHHALNMPAGGFWASPI